jgi:NADPH:quinone reductase-like Zn-dependent oxidoreductase
MKAIVQDRYGSADVLELQDVPVPDIEDDEVLVRVHAASVSAAVWHLMTGLPYLVRITGFGLLEPKIPIPGTDVAGRVEAVGKDVAALQPGDEVLGVCEGAFAEYAWARPDDLVKKPQNVTFVQAAAVPDSGHTALKGLRQVADVQPGQRVLIIGAGGGVGTFAVQIGKDLGAEVTGVCSTSKISMVHSIGADHVIDYTQEDFTKGERRFDVILDTAGRRPVSHLRRVLTPRGVLVIVGGEGGGRWLGGFQRQVGAMILSPFLSQRLGTFVSMPTREGLIELKGLIETGKLTPVVSRTYPLSETPEAIRTWERGHTLGKIVIEV